MALLIKALGKQYGSRVVLQRFEHSFPDKGIIAMMGPSGCGKTTLLRLVAGLEPPDSGEIIFSENERISMVFQENRLLPALSAVENIAIVLEIPKIEALEEANIWLGIVGLANSAHLLPDELSGGMQRRVAIARALAYKGNILILDEPLQGMDIETRGKMLDIISEKSDQRLTIMVTHNIEEALKVSSSVIVMGGEPLRVRKAVDIPVSLQDRNDETRLAAYRSELEASLQS